MARAEAETPEPERAPPDLVGGLALPSAHGPGNTRGRSRMLACLTLSMLLHGSALAAALLLNEQSDVGAVSRPSEAISVEIVASTVLEALAVPKVDEQTAAKEATSPDTGEALPEEAGAKPPDTAPEEDEAKTSAALHEVKEAAPRTSETTEHSKPKPVSEEQALEQAIPQPDAKPDGATEASKAAAEMEKAREAAETARREAQKREEEQKQEAERRERAEREQRKREDAAERGEAEPREHDRKRPRRTTARPGGATAKSSAAGVGSPSRASASSGSMLSYAARVRAQVASHKPSGAGARGTAVVSFGVTTSGGLSYASISRSSGDQALDRLALSAVRGASPFPAPPAGASPRQLRFSIPFHFQ
jgi:protein TonB